MRNLTFYDDNDRQNISGIHPDTETYHKKMFYMLHISWVVFCHKLSVYMAWFSSGLYYTGQCRQ